MSKFLSAVVLALVSGAAMNAHADVVVCNKSNTHAMSVAMAHQRGTVLTTPYSVFGWKHVPPNRCEFLAKGDLVGASVWVLAVSKGIILTRGKRERFSAIKDSDQRFCISDGDFEYDRRDVGATRSCPRGQYLATFPITVWDTQGVADLTIEMNPDDFVKGNAGGTRQGGPKLPDLHGALARAPDGTYYASYLHESSAEALSQVMAYCASKKPGGAACQSDLLFKSQCVAVASGRSQKVYRALGQPDWGKTRTTAQAMSMCRQAEGDPCVEEIAVCSTYGELSAQSSARDAKAKKEILGALGGALGLLWNGRSPSTPTRPDAGRGPSSGPKAGATPVVQVCTPVLVDGKGRFFPAAKAAIDNGDMARHFEAVNKNIDVMKADPRSALHGGQPAHLQLVFGSFQSADKAPSIQTFSIQPGRGARLPRCPPLHRQETYPLAAWMHKSGIGPRDVPRVP